jgi:hypothetical protein
MYASLLPARRLGAAAMLTAMAVFSPVSAWASCVNKTNGDGTHTITCCGETACYYTTWRGSTLIDEGTLP